MIKIFKETLTRLQGGNNMRIWLRRCHTEGPFSNWEISVHKSHITSGQPTSFSHPHLLEDKQLQPGVEVSELHLRRQHLIEEIWTRHPSESHHLVIVPSAPQFYMTERIPYPYRQSSDLLYLSGCTEPGATLLLASSTPGRSRELLFVRGRDPRQELWDGPRFAANQASAALFGVDEVLPASELVSYLQAFVRNKDNYVLWYEPSESPSPLGSVRSTVDRFLGETPLQQQRGGKRESPRPLLHRLRLIKSPAEARLMARAGRIGAEAIGSTIAAQSGCAGNGPPWLEESHIAARVDFECRARGAQQLAYPPVVAAGQRANTIHYVSNNQRAGPHDLVLMDAGCEYFGYNSDITRTWPVSGRFSEPQRALYEAVLDVQQQLLALLAERPSLDQLFATMCQLIGHRLRDLAFLPASAGVHDMTRAAHLFCPHHVSHFLGMDVHDTNTIAHNEPLRPGMVLTIEPGIYVSATNSMAPKEFRGLGIRIEDDVLITDSGPVVLSADCPKSVPELEELMDSQPCVWP